MSRPSIGYRMMADQQKARTILVLGTLDTKEDEVLFLKHKIESAGHKVLIVDAGVLNGPRSKPDVSREEVALGGGESLEALLASGDKGKCIATMIKGATTAVRELFDQGRFDGIISIGGAQGAAIGTAAMRALPFGVPKLMVTPVASGQAQFGPLVGSSDVTIMHSVVDMFGINSLSARVLRSAAGAIVGMVEGLEDGRVSHPDKPRIALTVLGNTTPAGMTIKQLLTERGYEVVCFHGNGTGGVAMEGLIAEGYFEGVLDLTTHEIADHEFGGLHAAIGPHRLEQAGKEGLPQVVVPGCIDYLVFGPLESIPLQFQGCPYVVHNPVITLVRLNQEEMVHIAEVIANKLNKARGPVAVAMPLQGLSMHNVQGQRFFDPQVDKAFREALKQKLRSDISVDEVDAHINAPVFAEHVVAKLLELMDNKAVYYEAIV